MRWRANLAAALARLAAVSLVACSSGSPDRAAHTGPANAAPSAAPTGPAIPIAQEEHAGSSNDPMPRRPIALVTDPAALAEVAADGGALEALVEAPGRAAMWRVIERDVAAVKRSDPKAGVGIRGNPHRLFDVRWLARGRFELVGVAPRLDRIPQSGARCGELHLLYRLAYSAEVSGEKVSSRLPMTIAVLLAGEPARSGAAPCRAAAAAWMAPDQLAGAKLGRWLVGEGGALGSALDPARVIQVRVNLQQVRWPSAVRPDLGGHAEYLMRSFRPGPGGRLEPAWLENTPDVPRIARDRALRARLLGWIRGPANLDAIEAGTALLPDEFLTRRAVSVAPRGLARRANRPFRQLVKPHELDGAPLASRSLIGSPEALLRRLDDMSCTGCHQSRTIAGFHLLGEDGPDVAPGNALAVAMSVPLVTEARRRAALTAELAAGRPGDFTRPLAERAPDDRGQSGARCGLGDAGFASWTCAADYECVRLDAPDDDAAVGVCLPDRQSGVGDPCEVGPLRPSGDGHRDRVIRIASRPCAVGVCNSNRVGFPGGMCTASCDDLPDGASCGVIAELTPFNDCLARKTPFPRCLAEHVFPAGLRACSAEAPCREDYICARTPSGQGTCIPPYFLFQLRVDGHP